MATATISIEVDADDARAFEAASREQRQKFELLLRLRLRELTARPVRSLREIMDEIGANAEKQGASSETVESLLHGE